VFQERIPEINQKINVCVITVWNIYPADFLNSECFYKELQKRTVYTQKKNENEDWI